MTNHAGRPFVRIARRSPGWPDRVGMSARLIGCADGLCVVYLTVTGQCVTVPQRDIDHEDTRRDDERMP